MHGAAVREGVGDLAAGFAGRCLADDGRPLIFTQGGGKELRRAVAVAVHENRHGQLHTRRVRGLHGLVSGLVGADEYHALGQQVVEQRHKLRELSAGIRAHVEDKRRRALVNERLDGGDGFRRGAVPEVVDVDIADAAVEHLIAHGRAEYDLAGHRDVLRRAVLTQDGDDGRAAVIRLNQRPHVARIPADDRFAVHGEDDIPGGDARPLGGAVLCDADDEEAAGFLVLRDRHADALIDVRGIVLIRGVCLRVHVVAPVIVEALHRAGERAVRDLADVIVADEARPDDAQQRRVLERGEQGGDAAEDKRHDEDRRENTGEEGRGAAGEIILSQFGSPARKRAACTPPGFLWWKNVKDDIRRITTVPAQMTDINSTRTPAGSSWSRSSWNGSRSADAGRWSCRWSRRSRSCRPCSRSGPRRRRSRTYARTG